MFKNSEGEGEKLRATNTPEKVLDATLWMTGGRKNAFCGTNLFLPKGKVSAG